jgi:hypothetical protein
MEIYGLKSFVFSKKLNVDVTISKELNSSALKREVVDNNQLFCFFLKKHDR